MDRLTILHLSDIHLLGLEEDSTLDPDRELRDALEADVESLAKTYGSPDVIVIGGDVVATGKPKQFEAATTWIERLCELVDCDHTDVFCVPGNHDVDRDAIGANGMIGVAHHALRTCSAGDIDKLLQTALGAAEQPEMLLAPLDAYRDFALQYDCPMEPGRLRWKRELPVTLAGRPVRLVGLSSALICDANDARTANDLRDERRKVLLGAGQAYLHGPDESIVIVVCHHPPHWLRDESRVMPLLARAQVQLFGHEHQLRVDPDGEDETVRIRAGAVQPERDGATTPTYNLVRLEAADDHHLRVSVFGRGFNQSRRFAPMDGMGNPEVRTVSMPAYTVGEESLVAPPAPPGGPGTPPEAEPVAAPSRREVIWQLMQLPVDRRRAVLIDVGALSPDAPAGPASIGPALAWIDLNNGWSDVAGRLGK